jgi:peptidoglycan-N-acetylglucosamine deacetylase
MTRSRIKRRKDGSSMRAPAELIGAATAAAVWVAASTAFAQTPPADQSVPACWSAQQLSMTTPEQSVRKLVREAFIAPPQRPLADFSPFPAGKQRGVIRRVNLPPGKKLVALTFDLCEEPSEVAGYQGGIVDFLRSNRIKATFFAGGKWMMSHNERAQQLISDPLFQIGNHTWEHRNLRILHGQKLADEINNAQLAYEEVRAQLERRQCVRPDQPAADLNPPKRLNLLRFPFGACNPEVLNEVYRSGLTPVQWDVSSGDAPPGQSQKEMFKDVVGGVRPGSIVLFHANGRGLGTEQALPAIVKGLRAKGYEFATVAELLQAGDPEIVPTCYDHKPGDTNHYDALAAHLEEGYRRARQQLLPVHAALEEQAPTDVPLRPGAGEPPLSSSATSSTGIVGSSKALIDPKTRIPLPRAHPTKRPEPATAATEPLIPAMQVPPEVPLRPNAGEPPLSTLSTDVARRNDVPIDPITRIPLPRVHPTKPPEPATAAPGLPVPDEQVSSGQTLPSNAGEPPLSSQAALWTDNASRSGARMDPVIKIPLPRARPTRRPGPSTAATKPPVHGLAPAGPHPAKRASRWSLSVRP